MSATLERPPAGGSLLVRILRSAATPILVLIAASVALVAVQVPQNHQFSPFDEYVYLDYLHKVPTQLVLKRGEDTGSFARQELACRGVLGYGSYGDGCGGSTDDDADFPYDGGQGADLYTPVYFASTWLLAQPLQWVGVDQLDAGRSVGALWLAGGVVLLYLTLRRLRVGPMVAMGLGLLLIATPAVHWANTYLSTDAPTLLAAAGVGYLGVLAAQRVLSPWWLVAASVVATALKIQNLGAVGGVGLALLLWLGFRASGGLGARLRAIVRDPIGRAVVVAGVAGVLIQGIWLVIRSALAVGTKGISENLGTAPLTPTAFVDEAIRFLTTIGLTGRPVGAAEEAAAAILLVLCAGAVIAVIALGGVGRVIGIATLVVSLVYGPFLVVATRLVTHVYVPLTPRYGIVLLPLLIACAGLLLRDRRAWSVAVPITGGALLLVALAT